MKKTDPSNIMDDAKSIKAVIANLESKIIQLAKNMNQNELESKVKHLELALTSLETRFNHSTNSSDERFDSELEDATEDKLGAKV